jgi:hypothetical protein
VLGKVFLIINYSVSSLVSRRLVAACLILVSMATSVASGLAQSTLIPIATSRDMVFDHAGKGLPNTGGRYDSITDWWKTMNTTNAPGGRYH